MIKLEKNKRELWEDLYVVWESAQPEGGWYLTLVTSHEANVDPSAPKSVTHFEILASSIGNYVVRANSKQEALLRHAAETGREAWSIASGERVPQVFNAGTGFERRYRLAKEISDEFRT